MSIFKYPLLVVLVPVCLFVVVASFYRFIVAENYIVEYEGVCDPINESCFVGCTDDTCSETYYYTVVRKYAADVHAQCGEDFGDCALASICTPSDAECTVSYCDPASVTEAETCEQIEGALPPAEPTEEGVEVIDVDTEVIEGDTEETMEPILL